MSETLKPPSRALRLNANLRPLTAAKFDKGMIEIARVVGRKCVPLVTD